MIIIPLFSMVEFSISGRFKELAKSIASCFLFTLLLFLFNSLIIFDIILLFIIFFLMFIFIKYILNQNRYSLLECVFSFFNLLFFCIVYFCGNATSGLFERNELSIFSYSSMAISIGIPIDK